MKRHNAFTLVELLVVIGIIALLISILLPALSKARSTAVRVACTSNMKQAYLAFTMYLNDNRGTFPPGGISVPAVPTGRLYWGDLLKPYLGERFPDPAIDPNYVFWDGSPLPRVLACPFLSTDEAPSTAWNGLGYNNYGLAQGIWADLWLKITRVHQTTQVALLIDCMSSPWGAAYGGAGIDDGTRIIYRHSGWANVLYVDGHAESAPNNSIQTGWTYFYRQYPYMEDWR